MDFILDKAEKERPDHIHFAGDIFDNHALGRFDNEPNSMSMHDELIQARRSVKRWYSIFPNATVSIGNHDVRYIKHSKLSPKFLRNYQQVYNTPNWDWQYSHVFDNVRYEHGDAATGKDGAINLAMAYRQSIVVGHTHTWGGVKWHTAASGHSVFGLNVGCGVDSTAYAFNYAKWLKNKPTLGCGLVIDGEEAYFLKMPDDPKSRYRKRRRRGQRKKK
jgi:hypothetical protein